jgi:hypothetical protein
MRPAVSTSTFSNAISRSFLRIGLFKDAARASVNNKLFLDLRGVIRLSIVQ